MYVEIDSNSSNESLARIIVAAFLTKLNPTASEIEEVKMERMLKFKEDNSL